LSAAVDTGRHAGCRSATLANHDRHLPAP